MGSMGRVRRKFQILVTALISFCVITAALTMFFLSRSGEDQHREFQSVRTAVQTRMKQVIPPSAVQGRVEQARSQIADFYKDRLASEPSAVYVELGKIAAADHVQIGGAKYQLAQIDLPNVQMMTVEAALSGSYINNIKFINSLERSKMFFIVNGIGLDEQQGGGVHLTVKLEAFVRGKA